MKEKFIEAKRLYETANADQRYVLETLFPELKESEGNEDEKIRKAIIEHFAGLHSSTYPYKGFTKEQILAWLEKQGEQKKELLQELDEERIKKNLQDNNFRRMFEQRLADKVKPKFHERDWVVTSYGKVNQVVSVDEDGDGYTLDDGVYFSGSWCDMYHLWTIQDAKDGDVLFSLDSSQPFIYQERKPHEQATAYCGINIYGKFFVWNTEDCIITLDRYIPATKEQRDTLVKAMTDAGYTFDFEKKELKKIKQPHLQWNISDYKTWQYIVSDVLTKHDGIGQYLDDGLCKKIAKYMQEEWSKKLCLIQHTAWSEEDSVRLQRVIDFLWHNRKGDTDTIYQQEQDIDWLKSLKDRCTWKPSDKVELKFHEGDWIVISTSDGRKIVHIVSIEYFPSGQPRYITSEGKWLGNGIKAHLWNITQDAKDGDVLSYRDGQWCFIYKGIVTEDTFKYYALLSEKGITVNDAAFSLLSSCITPATKEQRDALIKAMYDAGWEFDFEKKELKKIEQKPEENHLISLKDFQEAFELKAKQYDINLPNRGYDIYAMCKELYSLLIKQNPAWCEEDKNRINRLIAYFEDKESFTAEDDIAYANWLKSLKDRVQPQNTWKPSDEQINAFDAVLVYNPPCSNECRNHLITLYNDLKKLK